MPTAPSPTSTHLMPRPSAPPARPRPPDAPGPRPPRPPRSRRGGTGGASQRPGNAGSPCCGGIGPSSWMCRRGQAGPGATAPPSRRPSGREELSPPLRARPPPRKAEAPGRSARRQRRTGWIASCAPASPPGSAPRDRRTAGRALWSLRALSPPGFPATRRVGGGRGGEGGGSGSQAQSPRRGHSAPRLCAGRLHPLGRRCRDGQTETGGRWLVGLGTPSPGIDSTPRILLPGAALEGAALSKGRFLLPCTRERHHFWTDPGGSASLRPRGREA